jgi:hypothetical protein
MSSYTKTTNFTAKDNLTSGDPAKVIKGAEFDTEFNSIETAVNSKANSNNTVLTGTADVANVDAESLDTQSLSIGGVAVTATPAELNTLDGITSTTEELNILDGVTATTTELNYVDGVTSNIQTQLDSKADDTTSPTLTLDGDVSGSATLTNLGDATLTVTVADDSHNHTIANVDGLQTALDGKAPTASPTFTGTATIPSVDINGGAIDNTIIGGNMATQGIFTDVEANSLTVSGDNISFNTSAGDLDINPLGGGSVELECSGTLGVKVGGTSGFTVSNSSGESILKANLNGDVQFYEDTGTTPKMTWSSSAESLGIGTASPSQKLHVESDSTVLTRASIINTGNGVAGAGIQLVTKNGSTQVSNATLRTDNAGNFSIFSGTTSEPERMRIDSSGNLLVGKTSANGGVDGFEARAGGFTFITTNDANGACQITERNTGNSGSRKVLIVKGGTFNSTDNTSDLIEFRRGDNTVIGTVQRSGSNSVSYVTSSDYRLKENISTMNDASERVKALKPCRFNFIDSPEQTVDGFLAHEAQEVVPEAVTGTKDAVDADGNPEYQGIDQSKLVPLLTKALQEALTKIEQLETRIETLENK